jgi:glutathione S-transferase
LYKLISATPSPYARKVRIALAEKGIPFELITEVPWNRTTSTPQYNPLEKLPVLICEDGHSVYESRFILEYLELKNPTPRLLPDEVDDILAARRLEVLCDGICDALVLTFFERRRQPEHQSREWIARQRRKVDGGLREMERLVSGRDWAVGNRFGLGDIAVGTAVGYIDVRFPEIPWRELHPGLAAHGDRLGDRPSFRNSVPVPQVISDPVV